MLDVLQWPALAVTLLALWRVCAVSRPHRLGGFALALGATALWAVWAWQAGAWALVALQAVLAGASARGIARNRRPEGPTDLELDALASIRSRRPEADFAALVREGKAIDRRRGERRRAA